MKISWGYSPKIEKYIPLGDFPVEKYLIIARQAIENLGWKVSHITENGLIAYTPISFQSYSEEISLRIDSNFAIVKSECIGIQMWFNDYGKNALNLEKFFHEFDYVEFHLQDIWDESIAKFREFAATQDPAYIEKAPLTAKNKIRNVLYLCYPQKGYLVTPIFVIVNTICFLAIIAGGLLFAFLNRNEDPATINDYAVYIGANSRTLVLEGQYWRLLTHQFVHWSLSHLFFNMYALIYIGLMVEHKLGSKKFLCVYLLSGVCGGLLSLIFHEEGYMGGASGSIFGLFGAFLALLVSKAFEKNATRALLVSTLIVSAIMLLNGIKGRVDNSAHIGGLISGFLLCLILFNNKFATHGLDLKWRYAGSAALTLSFALIVLWTTPNYQPVNFYKLEEDFRDNSADFNQIYRIPKSLPVSQQKELVRRYGIDLWKRNKAIVDKMKALNLNEEHSAIRSDYDKITNQSLTLVNLFYLACGSEQANYKREMDAAMNKLYRLKEEANNRGSRYWP